MKDKFLEKGLPASIDAERFLLGSVLLNGARFPEVASEISADDFAIDKHAKIFRCMAALHEQKENIEALTIANELMRHGQLESVDGLSYLISLDDGLPQIANLDSYIRVILEKATLRRLCFLFQESLNRCLVADEPSKSIIESTQSALMKVHDRSNASEPAESCYEIIAEAGGVNEFFSPVHGILSPWSKVDFYTGGWQKGDLVLIGARPSMGKTAFLLNLLWTAAAAHGKHCVFYTYEMHKTAIIRRLISYLTGFSYQSIQQCQLTKAERDECRRALDKIEAAPIRIVQSSGKSVMAIRAHAEKTKHRGQVDMIGIDYIGLMRSGSKGSARPNRTQELGEIAQELKQIGMDIDCPVVCLSQLNRAVESRTDKRPGMSDLRDSGEIEEHSDLIGFLHRPGYYNRDDPALATIAEFIIGKQRNGDTPIIELAFDRTCGKFKEE